MSQPKTFLNEWSLPAVCENPNLMIKVEKLTKRYAGQTAIKDLNFEVERGEIVGFLGPNGAGKSTTMRILSCFLPATSGRATVAGFDVFTESLQVRNHLGYMPENVPLYTEMRVNEYLEHRAALKGLTGKKLKMRVGEVKELTSLNDVQRKIIGSLSKVTGSASASRRRSWPSRIC